MIYSTFRDRPYLSRLLLGLIFVIGVAEVALAGTGILPTRYDWILGGMLVATTLVWTGVAALAGATAPVSDRGMKYAYGVLLGIPLAIVAFMTALEVQVDTSSDWTTAVWGLALWLWLVLAGLVGSLAPHKVDAKLYIPLVIAPLLIVVGAYSVFLVALVLFNVSDLWPARIGRQYIWLTPFVACGWMVFLLYWRFLSRLKWTHRLRSNLLFLSVTVSTVALMVLTIWCTRTALRVTDPLALTLLGVLTLAPFGAITFWYVRSESCREQKLRKVGVSMFALSITMASFCAVSLVGSALVAEVSAAGGVEAAGWGLAALFIYILGISIVSLPAGYLVSKMRHPHRNLIVAVMGPGLVTLSTMGSFWFGILEKSF